MQPPPAAGAIPTINVTLSPRAMTERFKAATEVHDTNKPSSSVGQDSKMRMVLPLFFQVPVTLVHSWEIESSELVFLEEVGQGASANVFKGKYRGQQVRQQKERSTITDGSNACGIPGCHQSAEGHGES